MNFRFFQHIPAGLNGVVTRFPVPVALMGLFTLLWIFLDGHLQFDEAIQRLMFGLVISAYLCVCLALSRESRASSSNLLMQSAVAAIVCALAWYSEKLHFNLVMALGAALLLLGNSALHRRSRNDLHLWDFTHKIWGAAVFATVGSIIYFVGINAIGAALNTLFGLNISDLIEGYLLPLGLGLLAPLYWLASIPPVDENYTSLYEKPDFISRAIAFLGSWLLAPLMVIYAVILLAYAVKIITLGELPEGEVAELTVPFLILGTLTWLLLEAPFARNQKLASLYRFVWFPVSLPAAILLAIAVWQRITEYGLTEERVALILCVIWSTGLGLWYIIGKESWRDIRYIPGFAALLLVAGSLTAGPLSFATQLVRTKTNLQQAGILNNQGKVKPSSEIELTDTDAAKKAKGSLNYLLKQDEDRTLRALFSANVEYSAHSQIMTRLNLDGISINTGRSMDHIYFEPDMVSDDVANFDQIHGPILLFREFELESIALTDSLSLDVNDAVIKLMTESQELGRLDLQEWIGSQTVEDNRLQRDSALVPLLNEQQQSVASILLQSLSYYSADGTPSYHIQMYVLTRGFADETTQ